MNWYKKITAQIWESQHENDSFRGDFHNDLSLLYEMEYKYFTLKKSSFYGHPKRYHNIINQLEQQINALQQEVIEPIRNTFNNWLENHAILSPYTWARKRVEDEMESGEGLGLGNVLYEYSRYFDQDKYKNIHPRDMSNFIRSNYYNILKEAINNIENYPVFNQYLETLLDNYKQYQYRELYDDGLQEFNNMYGKEFKTEEEARNFIDKMTINDIDASEMIGDWENINDRDIDLDLMEGILIEFYANNVFPLWYNFWKQKGIDKTRENIERIYQFLNSANSIGDKSAAINMALNAVHQNGSMLEYLEEDTGSYHLKELLDKLTSGNLVSQWQNELKQIGTKLNKPVEKNWQEDYYKNPSIDNSNVNKDNYELV